MNQPEKMHRDKASSKDQDEPQKKTKCHIFPEALEEAHSLGDSEMHRSKSQYRNQTEIKYLSKMWGNCMSFFCTCTVSRISEKLGFF